MHTLFFTGNGGAGIAFAASATAAAAAQAGLRTLLVSIGPSHSLEALLGAGLGDEPRQVAPRLEAWTINVLGDLTNFWNIVRDQVSGFTARAAISGEELPLLPGADLFVAIARIRDQMIKGYDLLVVDAGPHDLLLRGLAVPDSLRWALRLLFGLDRGPGRSSVSISQAIVPTTLIPLDWIAPIQEGRVLLETIRAELIDPGAARARYVLRPDAAALEEARLAIPALQLHGMAVDALVAGPLLPFDTADPRVAPVAAHQHEIVAEAARVWPRQPLLRLPFPTPARGPAALAAAGAALDPGWRPGELYPVGPPIEHGDQPLPFIAITMPGLRRETLNLTLSGDELIVRVGPYRRHLLLPDRLRNGAPIKASRDGERLIVRLRQ